MYLNAHLNETPVTMLMDTGSSINLVSERLVKEQNLYSKITSASFKLVGVTGIPLQVLGVIRNAHIYIKGVAFDVDLVVTSMMNEDCILGQSFLEKHKMILNFNAKTISNFAVSAPLNERPPKDKKLTMRCTDNNLMSNFNTTPCCFCVVDDLP